MSVGLLVDDLHARRREERVDAEDVLLPRHQLQAERAEARGGGEQSGEGGALSGGRASLRCSGVTYKLQTVAYQRSRSGQMSLSVSAISQKKLPSSRRSAAWERGAVDGRQRAGGEGQGAYLAK